MNLALLMKRVDTNLNLILWIRTYETYAYTVQTEACRFARKSSSPTAILPELNMIRPMVGELIRTILIK